MREVVVEACRAVWQAVPEQHRADLSKPSLERAVAEAVGRGWTPDALVAYLARDVDKDRLPAATVHSRLRELPAIPAPTIRVDIPAVPFDRCELCACGANLTYGHPHTRGCAQAPPEPADPIPAYVTVAGPETAAAAIAQIRADLAARRRAS